MLTLGDPGYEFWHRFHDGRDGASDHPIFPRWRRARELREAARDGRARTDAKATPAPTSELTTRGHGVLQASAEELQRRGFALLLADPSGVLLTGHGLEILTDPFVRDAFREGLSWGEAERGTNGIGTAIAERGAVAVIGRAHLDPRWHGLACYAAPIHDAHGDVAAILDVTGPVEGADRLIGLAVESLAAALGGMLARESLRASELFLAAVGHDLRSPLSAILNGIELLSRGHETHHRRVAELIRSSGRRMVGLLDQLSDVTRARLGAGLHVARTVPVDLASVARRAIGEVSAAHPDRSILLDTTGDPAGLWDEIRIEQLVTNLVGNAARHGQGADPVRVTVDGRAPGAVVLAVRNPGEIAASIRPYLFDPFRTTNRSLGLGLGLYIIQQVVEAHGGDVQVTSRDGTTTFRATLPRR